MVDFSKLMGMFRRGNNELPPGVEKLLRRADRPEDILQGIDHLLAENQVRLKRLRREFTSLESQEREERLKIEAGDLSERGENFVLDNLGRLDMRLKSIEGEMGVLTNNINALTMIEGKVKESQAMALSGFSDDQIEQILLDHSEKKEAYHELLSTTEVADEYDPLRAEQEARRQEMKAKIMAEKASRETNQQQEETAQESADQEASPAETTAEESEQVREQTPRRELEME